MTTQRKSESAHHVLISLNVTGGFLAGVQLEFADGLNCFIGGRGAVVALRSWVPRFTLLGARNSSYITLANREPARVVATAPMYSGYASGGPRCQIHLTRGLRSRCRIYYGRVSATTRP